jgi:predicted nucleic acid-binding protein
MVAWARLVVDCRAAGVQRAVKPRDALIAVTAVEHGVALVTGTMTPTELPKRIQRRRS